ncbi:cuticle protein 6-like [Rhynchophorus ferrugineus]|uniref:cuticle protein 6-like n=1 Tax=Rhynchophorus ferrugineus TaxID=354439 RepID=UPI003FCC8C94
MNTFLILFAIFTVGFCRPHLEDTADVKVTQNSLGSYKYQVSSKDGSRVEERFVDGTITGEYIIPGSDGRPQVLTYIADADGFRVIKGPVPAPVSVIAGIPTPVEDTPEVKAAKEAFFASYNKALEAASNKLQ